MFCNNCGKEISENAKFCPFCGSLATSLRQEEATTADVQPVLAQKRSRKKSKAKIVLLVIVLVLALTVATVAGIFFTSPARQLSQSLSDGDYSSALETYTASVSDSSIQKWLASRLLSNDVSSVVEDYANEDVSYDEAFAYLETVSQMTALNVAEDATIQLESLQTIYASKQAYDLAESYYEAEDYEAAMEAYQDVDESDTERYEDAQSKIASATENYRAQVIEKVGSPSTVEEYETAISLLNSALAVLPDDEELSDLLGTYENELVEKVKSTALSEATDAIAAGEYEEAFDLLEAALKYAPEDSDLQALVSSAQSQYEEYIASEVESLVAENNYDDALSLLDQALQILPESATMQALYDTTYSNQPEKLCNLALSDSSDFYKEITDAEDTVGNTYHSSNIYEIWYHNAMLVDEANGYGKYYLSSQYTTLEFTLAISSADYSEACILTIYGDNGDVLYTSGELGRATAPQSISIDVSGVEWITFEANCNVIYYGTTSVHLLLIDPILYKN